MGGAGQEPRRRRFHRQRQSEAAVKSGHTTHRLGWVLMIPCSLQVLPRPVPAAGATEEVWSWIKRAVKAPYCAQHCLWPTWMVHPAAATHAMRSVFLPHAA